MARLIATAASALLLTMGGTVGHAQESWTATPEGYAEHLSTIGAWQFSAQAKWPDGKPVCFEAWTFAKDGTGSVVSGAQEIDLSWSYVKDDVQGMLLRITYERSSAGKDCLGRAADPSVYPKDNGVGFELLFSNGGKRAYVCNAPKVVMDESGEVRNGPNDKPMTLQSLENCWGNLTPVPQG